jgi:aminoglycoside 3-N-acetyltransferase I
MTYSYRRLTRDDVNPFAQLRGVFGEAFDDVETFHGAPPRDDYIRALLGKESFIAVVALLGEQVVGGLTAYVLDKYERERAEVYIYDLAVAAAHRRRGVARQLIRTLKPIAKASGAYVIFVQADPPDDPAIRLYESMGTREDVHHFDIGVD